MDRLVKCTYLVLTKSGFSTILSLISFVVWEMKDYKGISVRIGILEFWHWVTVREYWYGIGAWYSVIG